MAPSSPSQRIVRLGVAVIVLILLFYFTSEITTLSAVKLLRGHGVYPTPTSSSALGQNVAHDIHQPANEQRHVERDLDDLAARNDAVPGTPSSLQLGFHSAFPSLVARLSTLVPSNIRGQQIFASSPSTFASATTGESLTPEASVSTPRRPKGTVAGGSWTGGGNRPFLTHRKSCDNGYPRSVHVSSGKAVLNRERMMIVEQGRCDSYLHYLDKPPMSSPVSLVGMPANLQLSSPNSRVPNEQLPSAIN
ncbi:hypothetical protein PG993_014294 [Apiospora rasikravindrae]|uniref:Membrane-associated protein n=1 Tax=Apiospora rasikravindrae TaxID=990691 RepID=A0ABR1RMD0_9PEZI